MVGGRFGGGDGKPTSTSLAAGTVTLLLADVVRSTRTWEPEAGSMAQALADLQAIVEAATSRHGGVVSAERIDHDCSISVFARASDAAACAVDIQRTLREEGRPGGADLGVRVALHTGETDPSGNGTHAGPALSRCVRLGSIGHGGQILASQATYELVVDALEAGISFRDLGVHRLSDRMRPEHVWQLSATGTVESFPPLLSLDVATSSLPVQLTSFVGRASEIEHVRKRFADSRLVTLTGAGGCGKTRLAQQVATSMIDDCPDGIWWVDLAPLADPSLVPAALAGVLGVRESQLEPITETIAACLADRRALVVLDNCEHLIEACAELATRLVQRCDAVCVLATSREPLRVDGEATWPVPPLPVPADHDPGRIEECDSVRLFVDRARAVRPDFAVTPENAAAVGEICTRLDGIPLAIELAAARAAVLSVDQISTGLTDRFHLLTGGARTALPRQRTLEGSVDWSHDLLGEIEQVVFRRLAVFAGSFTLDAAETVCAGENVARERVLDVVTELVNRSLVQVVEETDAGPRFRMFETIRDYARHRLIDAGDADEARERHLDYYVEFVERLAEALEGPELIPWLVRVDAEIDNLRAALDWSSRSSDSRRGMRLVGLLQPYWFARSDLAIGRARLEASVDAGSPEGVDRTLALSALCMIAYRAGDMSGAACFGDEAVALGRTIGHPRGLARALHWRAWVRYWGEADRETAWSEFEEAAALFRQVEDRTFGSLNLAMLAWALLMTTEGPRARSLLDEAFALAGSTMQPHVRCYCHLVFGQVEAGAGRSGEAEHHLRESLALARQIGDHYAELFARGFLAFLEIVRGRYSEARYECQRGLAVARENRSPNGEALMLLVLAKLDLAEGRLDDADRTFEALFETYSSVFPVYAAIPRAGQAQLALARSHVSEARRYAAEALAIGRETGNVSAIQSALVVQARLSRLDGDGRRAEDLFHEALDLACRLGDRVAMCEVLEGLGGAVADQGRHEEGARIMGVADRLRETIGHPRFPVHRPSHEADTQMLRDILGGEVFYAVSAEGAELPLEEAIAYARRGRGKRKRPAHGWDSLTPTERRVADLVAEGLKNREIGRRLFTSPRTVQTHVSRLFRKLGVSTRAELASKVSKHQAPAR